jgi:hypothetical protein
LGNLVRASHRWARVEFDSDCGQICLRGSGPFVEVLMKPKLLSGHDVKEIVMFQKYLWDRETMPVANFYARYQGYLGLSDEELKRILDKVTR